MNILIHLLLLMDTGGVLGQGHGPPRIRPSSSVIAIPKVYNSACKGANGLTAPPLPSSRPLTAPPSIDHAAVTSTSGLATTTSYQSTLGVQSSSGGHSETHAMNTTVAGGNANSTIATNSKGSETPTPATTIHTPTTTSHLPSTAPSLTPSHSTSRSSTRHTHGTDRPTLGTSSGSEGMGNGATPNRTSNTTETVSQANVTTSQFMGNNTRADTTVLVSTTTSASVTSPDSLTTTLHGSDGSSPELSTLAASEVPSTSGPTTSSARSFSSSSSLGLHSTVTPSNPPPVSGLTTSSTTQSSTSTGSSTAPDSSNTTTTTASPIDEGAKGESSTTTSSMTLPTNVTTTTTTQRNTHTDGISTGTTATAHVVATTDYGALEKAKKTTPVPTPTSEHHSSQKSATTQPDTSTAGYTDIACPEKIEGDRKVFEGVNGCLTMIGANEKYSELLALCQDLPKGDMISREDADIEHGAISKIMTDVGLANFKFFVNAYQGDIMRKNKSALVIFMSAHTHVMTLNDSVVHRDKVVGGVGALCKIPKHGLRWACPTALAMQEAPDMEYDLPIPPPFLSYDQKVEYKCKNESVSTRRWKARCTERGVIYPSANVKNFLCKSDENAKPVRPADFVYEDPMPNLTCKDCTVMGTDRCERTPAGEPDKCHCKEGWKGITCWRFPKFCPNITCPDESICEERVTHATCVCATERCVAFQRTFNRTPEMVFLNSAVSYYGPLIEFIIKMAMLALFPERGDTVQDSLQYMRTIFGSCSGAAYVLGGNPQTLKIDIAERRAMSIMFHFPQIIVHLLYALEVCHIDAVMSGMSDNKWKSSGKDKRRWDYGWTYAPTITLGLIFSVGIWYMNWATHQSEYSSIGVFNSANLGMLGWASMAYAFCAMYSFWKSVDVILNENRRHHEVIKRDNKYETCHDPKLQENEDKCWRNYTSCLLGAPIQCMYSISMLANLAYESRELKYANLVLLYLNCLIAVMQTMMCDRKFIGRIRAWNMLRKPLVEQYNRYTYLTTSETIALKGRAAYEDMLQKRIEAKEKEMEEKREKHEATRRLFEEKGIPITFLPHFPLEGPPLCKVFDYDPCQQNYMCAREREWKFIHWTNEFLGARVKVGITVADAIEHVKNGLLDNGFLAGDECSSEQALMMFKQWMEMMFWQDRLDYARPNRFERRFIKNLDENGFFDDMAGLSVANRVREAPIDPRKRRLIEPVADMFAYSATDEMTIGLGLFADQFGFLWECKVIKDQGCFTNAQEARVWGAIVEDCATDHARHDQIYSDDERYNKIGGKPYEAILKEFAKVKEAFPEGRNRKSLNPLKGSIDIKILDQNRPDFIGPRQPEYQIPAGPLLRRFFCERIYRERRNLVFDILGEQAAQRRNNRIIRQNLRAHKKSKCTIM